MVSKKKMYTNAKIIVGPEEEIAFYRSIILLIITIIEMIKVINKIYYEKNANSKLFATSSNYISLEMSWQ